MVTRFLRGLLLQNVAFRRLGEQEHTKKKKMPEIIECVSCDCTTRFPVVVFLSWLVPLPRRLSHFPSLPVGRAKGNAADEEELDPTQYFANRSKAIAQLEEEGTNPYPHKFLATTSIPDYVAQYQDAIEVGEKKVTRKTRIRDKTKDFTRYDVVS